MQLLQVTILEEENQKQIMPAVQVEEQHIYQKVIVIILEKNQIYT